MNISNPGTGQVTGVASVTERMRSILDLVGANVVQAEDLRRVPDANVQALRDIGYLRGMVPRAYGGSEESPVDLYRAARLLASICPSTAWATQLLMGHAHVVAAFSKQAQDEVWGNGPDSYAASSVAPAGKFTPAEGGFHLTGRYQFSSGCDHAHWVILGGMRPNAETGASEHCLALVPRAEVQIVDTWFTAGLKGTGSKDIVIDGVFVPEHRIETMGALFMGQSRGIGLHDGELYRIPFSAIFGASFSVVALGAADGMVRAYSERLRGRVSALTGLKTIDSAPSLMRLAESHQDLRAATALIEQDWHDFLRLARGELAPTPDVLVGWRTTQSYVVKIAVQATDRLYNASGGSAGYLSNPAQRFWRDVHMAAGHYYVDYDIAARVLGRHLMGLPPEPGVI
ncbi:acyl-CoA dehydrogenase family protein [Gemmobacter sp.]|uniref:acyl-CoA dehydrogenase family protein n=1 Tax=Gemmobacter sp. TaxID=1898957 RepID=UPI002AFF78F4|nr:acyl-CoA dehydrogenase family protein [Gemmobacter sp.]